MVRLTDRPDMTLDVYRGRKTTMQQATSGVSLHSSRVGKCRYRVPKSRAHIGSTQCFGRIWLNEHVERKRSQSAKSTGTCYIYRNNQI